MMDQARQEIKINTKELCTWLEVDASSLQGLGTLSEDADPKHDVQCKPVQIYDNGHLIQAWLAVIRGSS